MKLKFILLCCIGFLPYYAFAAKPKKEGESAVQQSAKKWQTLKAFKEERQLKIETTRLAAIFAEFDKAEEMSNDKLYELDEAFADSDDDSGIYENKEFDLDHPTPKGYDSKRNGRHKTFIKQ